MADDLSIARFASNVPYRFSATGRSPVLGRSSGRWDRLDLLPFAMLPLIGLGVVDALRGGDTGEAILGVCVVIVLTVLSIRILRVGTFADAHGVVVRRRLSSSRWPWREIADIRVNSGRLELHLVSGWTVPLRHLGYIGSLDATDRDVPWSVVQLASWMERSRTEPHVEQID